MCQRVRMDAFHDVHDMEHGETHNHASPAKSRSTSKRRKSTSHVDDVTATSSTKPTSKKSSKSASDMDTSSYTSKSSTKKKSSISTSTSTPFISTTTSTHDDVFDEMPKFDSVTAVGEEEPPPTRRKQKKVKVEEERVTFENEMAVSRCRVSRMLMPSHADVM